MIWKVTSLVMLGLWLLAPTASAASLAIFQAAIDGLVRLAKLQYCADGVSALCGG